MPTVGDAGVTAMDCSVAVPAAVTVRVAAPLCHTASRVAHYHIKFRAVVRTCRSRRRVTAPGRSADILHRFFAIGNQWRSPSGRHGKKLRLSNRDRGIRGLHQDAGSSSDDRYFSAASCSRQALRKTSRAVLEQNKSNAAR